MKFHLSATLVDYVGAVFEQDAGGEINELGKLSETEYAEKSHVLPRGYRWETESHLSSEQDVFAAAAQIATAEDIDDETKQAELEDLCYPWTTEDELFTETDALPGPPRPRWKGLEVPRRGGASRGVGFRADAELHALGVRRPR